MDKLRVSVLRLTIYAFLCFGSSALFAQQLYLTTSPNPATVGSNIVVSTKACQNPKDYQVSFYWGYTSSVITTLIGTGSTSPGTAASVTWTPPYAAGTYYLQAKANGVNCTYLSNATSVVINAATPPPSYQGYIDPKYVVVGVTYAPPGPSSFVQYTSGTTLATTKSTSSTFASATTVAVSISGGIKIPSVTNGMITYSSSTSATETSSSSSAVTLSIGSQLATKTPGTPNAYSPVNHDYDLVWLWLNAAAIYTVTPSQPGYIVWNGYGYDTADQPALDIWPVYVGYLNGHFGTLDPGDAKVLARTWAAGQTWPSGQGPGLTQTDFNQILQADPFSKSSYSVVLSGSASPATTTDGRFTISGGSSGVAQVFDYKQANPGSSPITQTFQNTYSNSSTLGQSTTTTTQQTFGVDVSFSGGLFITTFSKDLKVTQGLTFTDMASTSTTTTATQIDALSITGPPCATTSAPCVPAYTSFPEFDVYQDNIYGTFMFNGVN